MRALQLSLLSHSLLHLLLNTLAGLAGATGERTLGVRDLEVLSRSVAALGCPDHPAVEHKHGSRGKLCVERFRSQSRQWLWLGIWGARWTLCSH